MIKVELFTCYQNKTKNKIKIKNLFFFSMLIATLAFVGLLCFFVLKALVTLDLTISLAISDIESIDYKVVVKFSR